MKRSERRILTTHVGSLPTLESVDAMVAKQRAVGLDLINEGELTKGGDWLSYMEERFGGFEPRPPAAGHQPLIAQGKDREQFAEFYQYATEKGTLFYSPGEQIKKLRPVWVCTSPITYRGQQSLQKEIGELTRRVPAEDAFLTSTAPGSLEVYRRNEHYESEEAFVFAIAEAMRVEFEAIVQSGVVLQVDDAWLPALWDRIGMQMGLPAFKKRCALRVEALNHALRNVPEERVRYHLCWGSWHGPHAYDLELKFIVDLLLQVKAQAYLIEGANARHEHEYAVWDEVKLPAGKILVPGVITHSTDVVEHPELVAQRIVR
jgi:5-methyltetrahydropteroyltriglutamate--homocysteine methyltransferase